MPSSGYPMEDLTPTEGIGKTISACIEHAVAAGMEVEWLESFVGAYNHLKKTRPDMSCVDIIAEASFAGITEWDL